jgi:actin-related protein
MLILASEDLNSIFYESLQTIERLMLEQIEGARRNHIEVKKVVLVGGFGDSPALKEHLRVSLQRINNQYGTNVELVNSAANTSAIGVAKGAIMRAQDKINGPLRIPCRSIGVLYHVRDDNGHEYSPEVLAQRWSVCELTQEEYIMRTIKWIIKAVSPHLSPRLFFWCIMTD